jgi:prepilin-type N-terminal cleavage/methylation domain-containing protein
MMYRRRSSGCVTFLPSPGSVGEGLGVRAKPEQALTWLLRNHPLPQPGEGCGYFRPGYTLLEILVASVIGLMLMAALYATFDLVFKQTNAGRELTAESELSRAIINRLNLDITSTIGLQSPKSGGGSGGSSGSSSTEAASTGTATTTADTSTASTESGSETATTSNIPFQSGIIGTGSQLTLFISKAPKYLRQRFAQFDPNARDGSDIIRVTYYLHSSGKGLCRQERPWVTADGTWNSTDPDLTTEDADLIVPEVSSMSFEFASGSGYASEWDGSQGATSGSTNTGPPRAVRMTFNLEFFDKNGSTVQKPYTHTFPVRAAVGLATTPASTATTDTSTTPSTGS